jgi:hypothetical protein
LINDVISSDFSSSEDEMILSQIFAEKLNVYAQPAASEDFLLQLSALLLINDVISSDLSSSEDEMIISQIFAEKLNVYAQRAASEDFLLQLSALLLKYRDEFCVRLGNDPPTEVFPLKRKLLPDAQSVL